MSSYQPVTFSLPRELVSELKAAVRSEALTRSELVRAALRQYLREQRLNSLRIYGREKALLGRYRSGDVEALVDSLRK